MDISGTKSAYHWHKKLMQAAMKLVLGLLILAAQTHAAPPMKPNILFALADDWSYPHAGAYGCQWVQTPSFDRVSRDGLLFVNAYTPNAKCAPSRACILTGRNPWQLKAACNHVAVFPVEFITFPEALEKNGYAVGMTGKGWAPGKALKADGQPRPMTGKAFDSLTTPPPTEGISNNDYARNFSNFLDSVPAGQPWCFWYGGWEPHRPYEFGSGIAKGGKQPGDPGRVPDYWPDNEVVRTDMLDYGFEAEHFDRHLGRMLAELEKRGELDNTIVVVTADNGMPFPRAKGNGYEISNHMPLAVMWKNGIRSPGRKVDGFVSFVDFAPTFVEAAGLEWDKTGMSPTSGRSLVDIFQGDGEGRDHVLLGQERHDVGRPHDWGYPIRGIVMGDWLYLRNFEPSRWPACDPETGYLNADGGATKTEILNAHRRDPDDPHWKVCFGKRPGEELYDLKSDPDCLTNLADSREHHARGEELRQKLFEELASQRDPRMFGQGGVFEAEPCAYEDIRNFYERYMSGEKIRAEWVNDSDFESPTLSPSSHPTTEKALE